MPTQNRRVATYLPPYIDDHLKTFKSERNIKGDSEALIAALSEYFQVSQEVAYPSSLNLLHRIEAIEGKLGNLKSELLSELQDELRSSPSLKSDKKSKPSSEIQKELLISDEFLKPEITPKSLNELDSSLLTPISGSALSKRFSMHKDTIAKMKSKYKQDPAKFTAWTKSKDPDGIAWEFHQDTKKYHPITDSESKSSIPGSLSLVEEVYSFDQAL